MRLTIKGPDFSRLQFSHLQFSHLQFSHLQFRCLLLAVLSVLAVLGITGCSEDRNTGGAEGKPVEEQGSPVTTIVYGGEKYYGIGSNFGDQRPEGLISTGTFTGPGDYMPFDLEIYQISGKPGALYVFFSGIEPGTGEWVEYLVSDTNNSRQADTGNAENLPEDDQP